MTRTNTPDVITVGADGRKTTTITTKRACNGCDQLLGDITDEEMQAAITGRPLPDVRLECPTCAPTAPKPACRPTAVLASEQYCLERDCDHDRSSDDAYCDQVREETVCGTHSQFVSGGFDYEEIVHAEPWPCQKQEAAA